VIDRKRGKVPPKMVRYVMDRDDRLCRYCARTAHVVDHVIPFARGGSNTVDNLVAACWACNAWKTDRTPAEAAMYLLTPAQALSLAMFRAQLIAQTFVDLYGSEAGSHEDMAKVMPAVFAAAQASVDAGDD